ncbi:hypothetical protein F5Y03DRAFT_140604 [Xylaria venustula]|nr:hypothetical protein F5Y03DRAFT_140604 [Xylaria venustula]
MPRYAPPPLPPGQLAPIHLERKIFVFLGDISRGQALTENNFRLHHSNLGVHEKPSGCDVAVLIAVSLSLTTNPVDRHNRIMAAILTRFRNMVLAATEPLPTAGAIPQASLNAMTMNNEVSALIKEVQNLLSLSREIKQLWIAGPLRKPGDASEKNREKEIDEKAAQVSKLHNILVELQNETAKKSAAQQAPPAVEGAEAKEEGDHVQVKRENESHSS